MKILFTKSKHYGKEVSECDSSYLIFLIESDFAEYNLVQDCKRELSQRLKLDWQPEPNTDILKKEITTLKSKLSHLKKVLLLSTICRGNEYIINQYLNNKDYLNATINLIKQNQQ